MSQLSPEPLDSERAYSETHKLKVLLRGLDISELLAIGGGGSGGVAPGSSSFGAASTDALAAVSVSTAAAEGGELLFGDLPAKSAGSAAFHPFMADLLAALARHYSGIVTGGDCAASGGISSGGGDGPPFVPESLQQGVALSAAVAKAWVTVAGPLFVDYTRETEPAELDSAMQAFDELVDPAAGKKAAVKLSASAAAAASTAHDAEVFLGSLFAVGAGARRLTRAAEEVALVIVKAWVPNFSTPLWGRLLELGRAAAAGLATEAGPSAPFRRLTLEAIALRSLLLVLCDAVVSPAMKELTRPAEGPVKSVASATPPRVVKEAAATLELLRQQQDLQMSEQQRGRLALLLSDSFILFVVKPFPTIMTNYALSWCR